MIKTRYEVGIVTFIDEDIRPEKLLYEKQFSKNFEPLNISDTKNFGRFQLDKTFSEIKNFRASAGF